ncbi:hypothetical protein NL108_012194 [Boleophthalmus pectinirostris]|nr:hypothetical protein NL108_012194 [Boleophthalmus pectinirostris]
MGIINSNSGPMCVELSPVASVWVQLVSSGSALDVSAPIHMRLPLCESCGLQDGQHLPAWTLSLTTGAWVRRGLGTVEVVDGKLMWTFTAPHLGHWMAAPLSPSRGVRLEEQLDFLLRHGSFLMILLGSTLVVAVCLLLGLLCHPRPSHTDSKLRRPAVNPLVSVKDQTTSTSDDQVLLFSNHVHKQYNVMSNAPTELQQDTDTAVAIAASFPDEQKPQNKTFENGLFFYNQPVAILHAPGFFQMEELSEEQWSKSVSLPRMDSKDAQENFTETKITNNRTENAKGDVKKFEIKSNIHGGLPESVSEPGRLGQRGVSAQGPRAWFVSLEGKPAAEVRYNVSEEPRRRVEEEEEGGSREASLDSGLDLGEVNQGRREVRLERNATFVKKSSQKHDHEKA